MRRLLVTTHLAVAAVACLSASAAAAPLPHRTLSPSSHAASTETIPVERMLARAEPRAVPPGARWGNPPARGEPTYVGPDGRLRQGRPGPRQPLALVDFLSHAVSDVTSYPNRTNGLILTRFPGALAACSGTVVNARSQRLVWTAAHCLRDPGGSGAWANRLVFVPAYDHGQDAYGAWSARELWVTKQWARRGNQNYDLGAAVMGSNDGTRLQGVVGSRPLAFSQPVEQIYDAYGYPADTPFDGEQLWTCESPYAGRDPQPLPGPVAIGIGCDMTAGASGGAWVINETHLASVSSFGYEEDPDTLYGPYLGSAALKFYKRVRRR